MATKFCTKCGKILYHTSRNRKYCEKCRAIADAELREKKAAVDAAVKRLEKLTKKDLIRNFRRVMVLMLSYMDIKGAYDTLNAVVCELDDRAAAMQNGKASERMYVE